MSSSSENRLFLLLFLSLLLAVTGQAAAQSRDFRQAPKALSALKQGQQAQSQGNLTQAIHFYCAAATTGNPEGYFRIGRLLATGPGSVRNPRMANAYLAMAIRLGNQQAIRYYNSRVGNAVMGDQCGSGVGGSGGYFA
ncbi:TPA: sel1 repeat family protein, partial [Aeromonas dhakensis]|nr:sel1 repeat family protein [Aeromonas dhakensis]